MDSLREVFGPLGGARQDILAAQIQATIVNSFRAFAGKRGNRKLTDFVLKWDTAARRRLSPRELADKLRSINRRLGGKEVRKR